MSSSLLRLRGLVAKIGTLKLATGHCLAQQTSFQILTLKRHYQQAPLFLRIADHEFADPGRRKGCGEACTSWIEKLETNDMIGMVQLDRRVFGAPPRMDILHRVVLWQRAKRRSGTAKTKTRAEVRGGGRKPWPQKGLGRARQGSIRAPHWRGGGIVHGPVPKSYYYSLPKQVRRLGLKVGLSVKFAQGDLHIVDNLHVNSPKTRDMVSILQAKKWTSVLFVDSGDFQKNFRLAVSNIQKVHILPSRGLNVYSMLLSEKLVLSVNAAKAVTRRLTGNSLLCRSAEEARPYQTEQLVHGQNL